MYSYHNIIILGAGESGNGAAILAKLQGFDTFVSDYGMIQTLYKAELEQYNIEYEEGGHDMDRILKADLIIKSPGIGEQTAVMKAIRAAAIPVISEIEWGFRFKGASKIVAITGSNGKTTTTSLTYHLFKSAGKDVSMVGNIGYSFAKQVALAPTEWYIMEVSSFQLDDITSFRPDIAVLLNITPDHLDRYDYSFEKYANAKFLITKYQTNNDLFIINIDDEATMKFMNKDNINARIIETTMDENKFAQEGATVSNGEVIMKTNDDYLGLPIKNHSLKGKHNLYNTMAAGISAMAADIRNSSLRESFSTFQGLEHRLEFVASIRGVDFINDSKATNLNSVWFALESMEKPVVLILGGKDKGNDYSEIMSQVEEKVKAIVCMGVDNAPIHAAFDAVIPNIVDTTNAVDAVKAAYAFAEKGDVVLLSPGCASFDLFKNYEDRGDQFKQAVQSL